MGKEIQIKPAPGTEVLVIREGVAEAPINKQGHGIEGNITAVVDFLSKRSTTVNEKTSHIEVDLEKGIILLIVDADSPLKVTVEASLYRPSYFEGLSINVNKMYDLKQIGEHLRKHRFLFDVRDEYDKVITQLTNFKAKAEVSVENSRSVNNGSKKNLEDKVVTVEEISFKMKTELYVGGEVKTFLVMVCCDLTDAGSRFWLESLDLIELERDERKRILDANVKTLSETYSYAIISK